MIADEILVLDLSGTDSGDVVAVDIHVHKRLRSRVNKENTQRKYKGTQEQLHLKDCRSRKHPSASGSWTEGEESRELLQQSLGRKKKKHWCVKFAEGTTITSGKGCQNKMAFIMTDSRDATGVQTVTCIWISLTKSIFIRFWIINASSVVLQPFFSLPLYPFSLATFNRLALFFFRDFFEHNVFLLLSFYFSVILTCLILQVHSSVNLSFSVGLCLICWLTCVTYCSQLCTLVKLTVNQCIKLVLS